MSAGRYARGASAPSSSLTVSVCSATSYPACVVSMSDVYDARPSAAWRTPTAMNDDDDDDDDDEPPASAAPPNGGVSSSESP